jgi:FAD/FMN-containing dehydrogenase
MQRAIEKPVHLLESLAQIVGTEHLLTDDESRIFFSTDVYRQADELAVAIAQPGTVEELHEAVRLCVQQRVPMVVRGGGASYTDGFLPTRPNTVLFDMSRLNRIEVNAADMYVRCEAGVTWAQLYERLAAENLRTPFWGPFSGIAATIGGGMSHYAVNYGSGLYGVSAESLIGMDVILGNGDMISTGSGGGVGHSPFFRFYGPDLAGMFIGDAGALGIKARFTLRLMRKPEGFAAASFGFPDGENCLDAIMETAKLGVLAQNFGLDPRQQKTALTEMESKNPIDAALAVFRSSRNPVDGAVQVLRMGLAGRSFLKNAVYSAHFSTEGVIIYEPTFLWEDEQTIYHRRVFPAELLDKKPQHPANPEGRALVKEIKKRIGELCIKNGASHMQVGKDYPYFETRKPEVQAFVLSLKKTVDPEGLMNPGALGLN